MSYHRCDFSENPRDKKKTANHTLAFVYPQHFSQDLRRSRVVGTYALLSPSSPKGDNDMSWILLSEVRKAVRDSTADSDVYTF